MAGGPNAIPQTRRRLGVSLTVLFGFLLLPAVAVQAIANFALADGERAHCSLRCVEPSGIRWEEAMVDLTDLRLA